MTWNEKYWDIISNIYWTPRFIGMSSVASETLGESNALPKEGRVYVRTRKHKDILEYLSFQEEVLNHVFNVTFAIAGDAILSSLLCEPLEIEDEGPFTSLGRELALRFDFGESNVTQPDGFFTTPKSVLGVELKLGSATWPEQIAKYLALMHLEERCSGKRDNLGLLFIVPESVREGHLSKIGVEGSGIDAEFLTRLNRSKLPKRIRDLLEKNPDSIDSVRSRVRLASVSWIWLRDQLEQIESTLDSSKPGEQTLLRLLCGLRTQIECHEKTGITKKLQPIVDS